MCEMKAFLRRVRQPSFHWLWPLVALALVACGSPSTPAPNPSGPWYADPAGDDSNDCLSPPTACATIQAAHDKAGPGDTVIAAAGTYNEHIVISQALILQGAGAGSTIIDAGGSGRAIEVGNAIVEISGLSIQNGMNTAVGGGLSNVGDLTLTDVQIESSTAPDGAAIFNVGPLSMTNVALINNNGARGAGLFNTAVQPVTAVNLQVTGNNATQAGAGIFNNGHLTISASQIDSNTAHGDGGGLFNDTGAVVAVTDSTIALNTALGGYDGGGFYNRGQMQLTNDQIIDNHAEGDGGGGGNFAFNANLQVTDTDFLNNDALVFGGALVNINVLSLSGGQLSHNQAAFGGALWNCCEEATTSAANVLFDDNEALEGGAINNFNGRIELVDSTMTNNRATTPNCCSGGGAIHTYGPDSTVIVTTSLLEANQAGPSPASIKGGAIYSDRSQVIIAGSTLRNNTAPRGGAIGANSGVVELHSSTIENNHATMEGGGLALYFKQDAAINPLFLIRNSTFTGNTSNGNAGAIFGQISQFSGGGPIFMMDDTTLAGNSAGGAGGAIYLDRGDITRVTLDGNTAAGNGGALYTISNALLEVTNVTISGNSAASGAATYSQGGSLYLGYVTVASNFSSTGPNVFAQPVITPGGVTEVVGSIVADNAGPNCGGFVTSLGGNLSDDNACQFNDPTDQKNTNPLLGPLANNGGPTMTHALTNSSPAIDTAACVATNEDQRQEPRPAGFDCDSGAYERAFSLVAIPGPALPICEAAGNVGQAVFRSISLRDLQGVLIVLDVPGGPEEESYMASLGGMEYNCAPDTNFPDRLFCIGPEIPGGGPSEFMLVHDECSDPVLQILLQVPVRATPTPTPTPTATPRVPGAAG